MFRLELGTVSFDKVRLKKSMTFFQAFCCNPTGCHSKLSFSGVIEDGQERQRGKQQERRMGQSLSDG